MPAELHARRRDALREVLAGKQLPAALVSDLVNVRYLTGFTGSNGALLVAGDGADLFATDGRYVDQATDQLADVERITTRALLRDLVATAKQRGLRCLAVETHTLTVDQQATAQAAGGGKVELTSLERGVETLRRSKDGAEIEALRTACAISTSALGELLAGELAGRTERAIARDLEWRMYAHGAEAVGFDTIVAGGPNSAIPHHQPTDRPVEVGDLVKIDFGARYAGYHADCTRTVVAGRMPADWQAEIYELVATAQRAGSAALAPAAELAAVDAAARTIIADAGFADRFTHGLGHGVGLQIHEDPYLGATATGKLGDRVAVTVEPGVYLPGRGGVRIEDTLVVDAGATTVLTTATKELLVVG